MTSPLSPLELTLLVWVSFDYETIRSIQKNVAEDAGRDVPDQELHATLMQLQERGLVTSYVYDEAEQIYVRRAVDGQTAIDAYWWMTTTNGNRIVETEPEGP